MNMLVPSLSPRFAPMLPTATSSRGTSSRLRVVQDGAQDCSTCRTMQWCWSAKKRTLTPGDVVSNLLVCRLQRGIERNKTTKLLLTLIRPKLRKMARWVSRQTGSPHADVVLEMESVAIESLLSRYVVGELAPPLVWLFHAKHGGLRHWALRTVATARRTNSHTISYDSGATDSAMYDDLETRTTRINRATHGGLIKTRPTERADESAATPDELTERCARALEVVEDGKTLSAAEYRVFAFCLRNNTGSSRATDWLHQHLARVMGIPRKDVSRLYGIACRKVIDAVGLRDKYLLSRGIEPPRTRRVSRTRPLSTEEVIAAVHVLHVAGERATVLDIAWALDVTDVTVRQLRRRFAGMTPEEVRDLLAKP